MKAKLSVVKADESLWYFTVNPPCRKTKSSNIVHYFENHLIPHVLTPMTSFLLSCSVASLQTLCLDRAAKNTLLPLMFVFLLTLSIVIGGFDSTWQHVEVTVAVHHVTSPPTVRRFGRCWRLGSCCVAMFVSVLCDTSTVRLQSLLFPLSLLVAVRNNTSFVFFPLQNANIEKRLQLMTGYCVILLLVCKLVTQSLLLLLRSSLLLSTAATWGSTWTASLPTWLTASWWAPVRWGRLQT